MTERVDAVRAFADGLIEFGRDRYGPRHTPLFVSQLDLETHEIPRGCRGLYCCAGRGGVGANTSNLQFDAGLLRLLDSLTTVTGDGTYANAVDDYLGYFLTQLPDEAGNFPWGDHRGCDVVADEPIDGPDEFEVTWLPWARLWAIDSDACLRQFDALRGHVIDERRSWAFNRHYPPGEVPHSMNSSGGAWIAAWAFAHAQTGEQRYLDWAEGLRDYLWSRRDPATDLLAAHPDDPLFDCTALKNRPRRTEYMGPWCEYACNLLQAAGQLGEVAGAEFRRQALAYMRAFVQRADITEDGQFHATFDLATGEPLFGRIQEPWRYLPAFRNGEASSGVMGARIFPALAFGYLRTGEEILRETFDRLVPGLRLNAFRVTSAPFEIPAGMLAMVITAFLNMYQATGEKSYRDCGDLLAAHAMRHYARGNYSRCGLSRG
ncbi:MAG: hypothetical protein ACOX9R_10965 [Armatimonadota bacterium]|jgi:hypothetical protein